MELGDVGSQENNIISKQEEPNNGLDSGVIPRERHAVEDRGWRAVKEKNKVGKKKNAKEGGERASLKETALLREGNAVEVKVEEWKETVDGGYQGRREVEGSEHS